MSQYKKYEGIFIDDNEINIAYEQDYFGTNYVTVPIADFLDEFTEGKLKKLSDIRLLEKLDTQKQTIENLQTKLYKYRMPKAVV